jgi:hypothetical protein
MKESNPSLYVIPDGFIELTRAREEAVRRWFGHQYASELTPPMASLEAKRLGSKASRARRWELARRLMLRVLRRVRLRAYVLTQGGQASPLDASYWKEWEPSWRPFERDPRGRSGMSVHLLRSDEWEHWLRNPRSSPSRRARGQAPQGTGNSVPSPPRGPRPEQQERAIDAMQRMIAEGRADELRSMKEEEMGATFKVSRDTARKARKKVLAEAPADSSEPKTPTISDN